MTRDDIDALAGQWIASQSDAESKALAAQLKPWWKKMGLPTVVRIARALVAPYIRDNITPTLRQVYYRFVAAGLCPNAQKSYDKIGRALVNARLDGSFPVDWIEDRTRSPTPTEVSVRLDVDDAIQSVIDGIQEAHTRHLWAWRWAGQRTVVSVWVEKEALASVFQRPCRQLNVGLFVCRGYPSVSALFDWVTSTDRAISASPAPHMIDRVVVLYFGDHDPDGLQIPASAEATAIRVADAVRREKNPDCRLWGSVDVVFERVALTLDQVREVDAPPMPAKVSSSRYPAYHAATGLTDAWELDALPPDRLDRLIRESVAPYFNEGVWRAMRTRVNDARAELRDCLTEPDFFDRIEW